MKMFREIGGFLYEYLGEILAIFLLSIQFLALAFREYEAAMHGFVFAFMFVMTVFFQKDSQKARKAYMELWSSMLAWTQVAKEREKDLIIQSENENTLKFRISDEPRILPSEALYGFASWLTVRNEPITLSARHEAGIAAELVAEFCKVNRLEDPRDGVYPGNLVSMGNVAHGKVIHSYKERIMPDKVENDLESGV